MNTTWRKLRSWHAVFSADSGRTRCGRFAKPDAERRDTLPAGRSCETCARLLLWEEERGK